MIIKTSNKRDLVLSYFLTYPTRVFHLRELARVTTVSFPWTRQIVDELHKQKLIVKEKKGNIILIKANIDSPSYRVLKRSHNFISLHQCGLVDFLIDKYVRPEVIVLFGSFEKGEDVEKSDIDIAIISFKEMKLDVTKYERLLEKRISLKTFTRKQIEKDFWNTLANGTTLYGYLELP
ncbi:MAG: nucleotidyltransferase domain-containing protein [Nanoarchaeota archaeon]